MPTSTVPLGIFYMPQICDVGPTALLPFRRKACWGVFRPYKIRRLRPGLNPRTWVPEAKISDVNLMYFWIRKANFSTKTCNFLDQSLDIQEFKNIDQYVQTKFKVLTVVLMKISVQYNMPPCRLVYRVRSFRGFYCPHLRGSPKRKRHTTDHQ
jgi:hypothetical protein